MREVQFKYIKISSSLNRQHNAAAACKYARANLSQAVLRHSHSINSRSYHHRAQYVFICTSAVHTYWLLLVVLLVLLMMPLVAIYALTYMRTCIQHFVLFLLLLTDLIFRCIAMVITFQVFDCCCFVCGSIALQLLLYCLCCCCWKVKGLLHTYVREEHTQISIATTLENTRKCITKLAVQNAKNKSNNTFTRSQLCMYA